MALFGQQRDVSMMRHLAREFISRIVDQEIIYYKIATSETKTNSYGETDEKGYMYYPGVNLNCLVAREDDTTDDSTLSRPDRNKQIQFRVLKDDLIQIDLVPEIGDIIEYNKDFYEVHNTIENEFIGGKDPNYALSDVTQVFGESWSILLDTHITRPGVLNIIQERL